MGFGKARYKGESTFKKKNYYNVTNEEQVFGILPPCFSLEAKGQWNKFYSVHFGYKNSQGKLRTFVSPEVRRDGKTIVRDAALERLKELQDKMNEAKEAGNTDLYNRLNKLVGMKGLYSVDRNYHFNVHDLQGNIGVLKIRHRQMLALEAEIEKLKAKGVDPLDAQNGRYFVFSKTGQSRDTTFAVRVYEKEVEAPGLGKVKVEEVRKITPELEYRAIEGKEAFDLATMFQFVTPEECAEIVEASDLLTGVSPACDRIFDAKWKAERDARRSATDSIPASTTSSSKTAAPVSDPNDEVPDNVGGEDYAAPQATAPAATPTQTPVAKEAAKAVSAPTAQTTAAAPAFEELDDDAFFAALKIKKA